MIAINLDNLANSELNYDLINYININKKNWPIFYKNIVPPLMNIDGFVSNFSDLSGYNGKVLSFDLSSLQTAKNICNGNAEFYIYLYDLEWLYKPLNYFYVIDTLKNTKIACRSEIHQKNIENYCNIEATICKNMKEVEQWITQN